jgi:small conductance mechanosensitive channel
MSTTLAAISAETHWHQFWRGPVGHWILTNGLHIVLVVMFALLVTRLIKAVEDVTLRVTKLRTGDGEVYTVPNGQIVKSLNLSKDWARAVVDIPVPVSADINKVTDVLRDVSTAAMHDDELPDLLLDEPQMMGVESIERDTVKMRMVARTLPGKQFEVGRRLRSLVVSALRRAGVAASDVETTEMAASRS